MPACYCHRSGEERKRNDQIMGIKKKQRNKCKKKEKEKEDPLLLVTNSIYILYNVQLSIMITETKQKCMKNVF
jgi:hypothetical protein